MYISADVQMMVTETETLTSILHHNIHTYLDYVFSATFIYIYIYTYMKIKRKNQFFGVILNLFQVKDVPLQTVNENINDIQLLKFSFTIWRRSSLMTP